MSFPYKLHGDDACRPHLEATCWTALAGISETRQYHNFAWLCSPPRLHNIINNYNNKAASKC